MVAVAAAASRVTLLWVDVVVAAVGGGGGDGLCDSYLVMRRWAYIAIVGYGVGVPLIYAVIIFRFSGKMKVDQALRIRGLSGARETNPFFTMQKRFKRLYFKYKPECHYWTLVIVGRKFAIVLLTAFTSNKPLFAATTIVLVLFVAYAVHVRDARMCLGQAVHSGLALA